jgi:P-type Cu+ transporter
MTTDPVCQMDVEETPETPSSVYKGTTYYFCCDGCKQAFDRNPDQYVATEP